MAASVLISHMDDEKAVKVIFIHSFIHSFINTHASTNKMAYKQDCLYLFSCILIFETV